jgi:hypothetical protein
MITFLYLSPKILRQECIFFWTFTQNLVKIVNNPQEKSFELRVLLAEWEVYPISALTTFQFWAGTYTGDRAFR